MNDDLWLNAQQEVEINNLAHRVLGGGLDALAESVQQVVKRQLPQLSRGDPRISAYDRTSRVPNPRSPEHDLDAGVETVIAALERARSGTVDSFARCAQGDHFRQTSTSLWFADRTGGMSWDQAEERKAARRVLQLVLTPDHRECPTGWCRGEDHTRQLSAYGEVIDRLAEDRPRDYRAVVARYRDRTPLGDTDRKRVESFANILARHLIPTVDPFSAVAVDEDEAWDIVDSQADTLFHDDYYARPFSPEDPTGSMFPPVPCRDCGEVGTWATGRCRYCKLSELNGIHCLWVWNTKLNEWVADPYGWLEKEDWL